MTVGPTGGVFSGTVWDPSSAPTASGTIPAIPQTRVIDANPSTGVATLPPAGSTGGGRLVRRVTVAGPAGSSARLFIGDYTNGHNLVDGSSTGSFDVAEYNPELYVSVGAALTVTWDRPGAAFMRVEWMDLP